MRTDLFKADVLRRGKRKGRSAVLSRIPGLSPPGASGTHPAVTTRTPQTLPDVLGRGQSSSQLRTTDLKPIVFFSNIQLLRCTQETGRQMLLIRVRSFIQQVRL